MLERNNAEWNKDVTREQKKYLCLRVVFFAAVFAVAGIFYGISGNTAGASGNGWLPPVIAALAGGYFPGFLGGIWKLYRRDGRRIISFQKYTAARMKRQAR